MSLQRDRRGCGDEKWVWTGRRSARVEATLAPRRLVANCDLAGWRAESDEGGLRIVGRSERQRHELGREPSNKAPLRTFRGEIR